MSKEFPYNWWDYGLNPILGYRYSPDGKSLPVKFRKLKSEDTSVKP